MSHMETSKKCEMDALYFLKSRTKFIRFFFEEGEKDYEDVKHRIDEQLPPFHIPPYSEDGEPPYLSEWLDAGAAIDLLGINCVSMLSDSLKLYFNTLQRRVIRFSFDQAEKRVFNKGFVPAYFAALGEILETDWSDCPVDRDLIEQIVLARNRGQHPEDLTSFDFRHDQATLDKHPRPFFAAVDELSAMTAEEGSLASWLMPSLKVSKEGLLKALEQVETLAEWIEDRLDRAEEWRARQRANRPALLREV